MDQTLWPISAEAGTKEATRIVVVDGDDRYRETLGLSLVACGYEYVGFASGASALKFLWSGESADLILLEWAAPAINGADVLRALRYSGIAVPVIVLATTADQDCEDAALSEGAVDFIDKSRRVSIILNRLRLLAPDTKPNAAGGTTPNREGKGPLVVHPNARIAVWKGREVQLTSTEQAILGMLTSQPGTDYTYRAIYDVARGKGFAAGRGPNGYRTNVRSFIKRIRKKMRKVDPEFDCIKNYFGFGYRWCYAPSEASSGSAPAGKAFEPSPARPSFDPRRSRSFSDFRGTATRPSLQHPMLRPSGAGG